MIKISKKADYAVMIMASLATQQLRVPASGALAAGSGRPGAADLASAQEIADGAGLSKALAANLLKALARAGLLHSVRGVSGGYRLSRPMGEINLAQILEAVEGPMRLVECAAEPRLESATGGELACSLSEWCPSRSAMRVVHERIAHLMAEIRLPELLRASTPPRRRPAPLPVPVPQPVCPPA